MSSTKKDSTLTRKLLCKPEDKLQEFERFQQIREEKSGEDIQYSEEENSLDPNEKYVSDGGFVKDDDEMSEEPKETMVQKRKRKLQMKQRDQQLDKQDQQMLESLINSNFQKQQQKLVTKDFSQANKVKHTQAMQEKNILEQKIAMLEAALIKKSMENEDHPETRFKQQHAETVDDKLDAIVRQIGEILVQYSQIKPMNYACLKIPSQDAKNGYTCAEILYYFQSENAKVYDHIMFPGASATWSIDQKHGQSLNPTLMTRHLGGKQLSSAHSDQVRGLVNKFKVIGLAPGHESQKLLGLMQKKRAWQVKLPADTLGLINNNQQSE